MPRTISMQEIEMYIDRLSPDQQLQILEKISHALRGAIKQTKTSGWDKLYGVGKGIWNQDAQEYVNALREDRQ